MNLYHRFVNPLKLADVFTPNTTAKYTYIQRKNIEDEFRKNIDINGRQIIIYGHSGRGKTTLTRHMLNTIGVNLLLHTASPIQHSMIYFSLLLTSWIGFMSLKKDPIEITL